MPDLAESYFFARFDLRNGVHQDSETSPYFLLSCYSSTSSRTLCVFREGNTAAKFAGPLLSDEQFIICWSLDGPNALEMPCTRRGKDRKLGAHVHIYHTAYTMCMCVRVWVCVLYIQYIAKIMYMTLYDICVLKYIVSAGWVGFSFSNV